MRHKSLQGGAVLTSCKLTEATKWVVLVHCIRALVSACSRPVPLRLEPFRRRGSGKSLFRSTSPLQRMHERVKNLQHHRSQVKRRVLTGSNPVGVQQGQCVRVTQQQNLTAKGRGRANGNNCNRPKRSLFTLPLSCDPAAIAMHMASM